MTNAMTNYFIAVYSLLFVSWGFGNVGIKCDLAGIPANNRVSTKVDIVLSDLTSQGPVYGFWIFTTMPLFLSERTAWQEKTLSLTS